ncbi:hypothetical protein NLI96_g945 [Meripilus lineatus]|uniref:F-box domain-containing protein n=1 Tax=Meripilus lineatus TaxID=2056292 RepID=A0AAD5YI11_9APHY|nr:hypothetical protein NLI96_g945 [Physisporinus lineatus]
MEESLRTLREERNTYSCAVRVPPEILTHIFLDVICDIYERDEEESIQQFYPPHVCRYWYEVASRSQQYWSYQRLADGELMPSHIIERAGGRPLHVWGYMSKYSPSCDFIRSQAESVKISTYGHSIPKSLEAFFSGAAPNLKSLMLSAPDTLITTPSIPKDTFDGNVPCLRSLTLHDVRWWWLSPIFVSSLTHLTLRGPMRWGLTCIQTLQQLPSLNYLDLTDTRAPEDRGTPFEPPWTHSPSVKLGRLKALHLQGEVYDLGILALELSIPLSALITFHPTCTSGLADEPQDLEPLLSWLSKHLQLLDRGSTPVYAMHLKYEEQEDAIILRLYHSPNPNIDPIQLPKAEDARPDLEVKFCYPYNRTTSSRISYM